MRAISYYRIAFLFPLLTPVVVGYVPVAVLSLWLAWNRREDSYRRLARLAPLLLGPTTFAAALGLGSLVFKDRREPGARLRAGLAAGAHA